MGLIRFIQNSVGEIHDSVKTYTTRTLVVPCQSCKRHVHVRVIDVLSRPDRPMDVKCKHCSHVVCFATSRSGIRSPDELIGLEPSEPRRPGSIIYGEPLSPRAVGYSTDRSRYNVIGANDRQSLSNSSPINSGFPSSQTSNSTQDSPARKSNISFNHTLRILYGNQSSTSNDNLHEFSEGLDSMSGQAYSHRSSISLRQEPYFSRSNLMLGLEQCGEKTRSSQCLWDSVSWHGPDSPTSSVPPRLSSNSPVPSRFEGRYSERDDPAIFMDLGKSENGQTFEVSVSRRNSTDSRSSSIDLTSGKIESGGVGRRNCDSDTTPFPDSDIRGSISEKRRGKLPMRSNAVYRAAVSRRHSLKIEMQEQLEVETLSAKRRNSMNTDFEVEPSDEEVRQAHKIYTETTQHPESDIQWARVTLRRREKWDHMRFENPLRGNMEQLQLRPISIVESVASTKVPGSFHQTLPFIAVSTTTLSRISSFSLPAPPTPVEEECEGDVLALGLAEAPLGQPAKESSVSVSKSTASALSIESEAPTPSAAALPTALQAERNFTTNVTPSAVIQPRTRKLQNRWGKTFKRFTKSISCFRVSNGPQLPSHTRGQTILGPAGPAANFGLLAEPLSRPQLRSSGEIQDVPTSEEPLIMVANEVAALVARMESPLFQVWFQARTEDLFPGTV